MAGHSLFDERPRTSPQRLSAQAFSAWIGPEVIDWLDDHSGLVNTGWAVLSLRIQSARRPTKLESRSLFGNPFSDDQHEALLRAVAWDSMPHYRALKADPEGFRAVLPARFVRIPKEQMLTWLRAFEHIRTTIDLAQDDGSPEGAFRCLRIEWHYTTCTFEKKWHHLSEQEYALEKAWMQVWREMGAHVLSEEIGEFKEYFPSVIPEFTYNQQTYDPTSLFP